MEVTLLEAGAKLTLFVKYDFIYFDRDFVFKSEIVDNYWICGPFFSSSNSYKIFARNFFDRALLISGKIESGLSPIKKLL